MSDQSNPIWPGRPTVNDLPTQPFLPPELPEAEATQMQSPTDQTRDMPAMDAPHELARPPRKMKEPYQPVRPPAPALTRRDHPLRLPAWSVLTTLALVGGLASCIILVILSLGGKQAPSAPPRFVILTAAATTTISVTLPSLVTTPMLPPAPEIAPKDTFALAGPTLPPIVISPTPETVATGKRVVVTAEDNGLNVRSQPGVFGSTILFVAPAGQEFQVIDGPMQADGFTWWRIRNLANPQETGWAAAVFLQVLTATNPAS